ncbi:hypothetical protein IMSAGC002_04546 [Lachnospiraceae bacterium]|nr:hypothetical protein IMSAGC002_04546 [Lachnospiraceae bacterium]
MSFFPRSLLYSFLIIEISPPFPATVRQFPNIKTAMPINAAVIFPLTVFLFSIFSNLADNFPPLFYAPPKILFHFLPYHLSISLQFPFPPIPQQFTSPAFPGILCPVCLLLLKGLWRTRHMYSIYLSQSQIYYHPYTSQN